MPQAFLSFHRPLCDYVAACTQVGLELRDLDEPGLSEEGRRDLPGWYVWHAQRAPFSCVLKFVRSG